MSINMDEDLKQTGMNFLPTPHTNDEKSQVNASEADSEILDNYKSSFNPQNAKAIEKSVAKDLSNIKKGTDQWIK